MSNVLTNNTPGSIILTLNNTTYARDSVISMSPGSSVLYNDIVVTDQADVNYNVPLIQTYIDNGILLNQTLTGLTGSELQVLSPANLTINMTTGIPKLLANAKTANNIDNQQLLVSNDMTGKFQYIYYKSIQGMSISSDFGASQTLINNANLLYPDEITSFAIQVYDSVGGILKQVNRLYIGTLREGVKTFTPSIDTTYVNFDENAVFGSDFIFKTTVTTIINTTYPSPIGLKTTIEVIATFCPTYVLAVINTPYTAGCPIFITSRPRQTTTTVNTTVNTDGTNTTEYITDGPDYKTKAMYKYLHSQIYVNNTLTTLTPNTWHLLQENDGGEDPLFPQHILDVITEYIPTGALVLTKSNESTHNRLYKITCVPNAVDNPVITEVGLDSNLHEIKIKNISYLSEITGDNYDIFITTDKAIWRYSSVASSNHWSEFIYAISSADSVTRNPIPYLDTFVENGALNSSGSVYLKELSNFILLPVNNTPNKYVGFLGSELGLISFNLKLVNNIFTANGNSAKAQSIGIARYSVITDIKYTMHGPNMYIFTCSYSSQIPRTWKNSVNYLQLINNSSSLVDAVYYLKPDVENASDLPYYVTDNLIRLNHTPSGEQVSSNPVLINSDYSYSIISPKYSFKIASFDSILKNALESMLAYKYYIPYITERIISSVSPAELTSLELNEYKHAFKMEYLTSVTTEGYFGEYYQILNQKIVTFTDTFIYDNSFLCVSLDGSIVLPTEAKQSSYEVSSVFTSYITTLTFSSAFSGTIYIQGGSDGLVPFTVNGLFALLDYSNSGNYPSLTGRYPQVILDSGVADLLNDIKYIDTGHLEISFVSPVSTVINLK